MIQGELHAWVEYYDLTNLPFVIITSPIEWDPKVLDSEINLNLDNWYNLDDIGMSRYLDYLFNKTGAYRQCKLQNIWWSDWNTDINFFEALGENEDKDEITMTPWKI